MSSLPTIVTKPEEIDSDLAIEADHPILTEQHETIRQLATMQDRLIMAYRSSTDPARHYNYAAGAAIGRGVIELSVSGWGRP